MFYIHFQRGIASAMDSRKRLQQEFSYKSSNAAVASLRAIDTFFHFFGFFYLFMYIYVHSYT